MVRIGSTLLLLHITAAEADGCSLNSKPNNINPMGKMPGPIGPIRLISMTIGTILRWVLEIWLIAAIILAVGIITDRYCMNKYAGTYDYTETVSITCEGNVISKTKTGSLTITNATKTKLHLSAPFSVDASPRAFGTEFKCDAVEIKDNGTDIRYEFENGYLDGDNTTLHISYVGTGTVTFNGKKTSCKVVSTIEGTKRQS